MASYFIDPAAGNDTTGDGSIGTPWKTLQKGIDNAAGGDQINVKDSAADVLAAAIDWTSGWSGGTSVDAPLVIRGYTSSENDGGIGEIDGDDAVASIFSTTSIPAGVIIIDMLMHNTTSYVIDPANNWYMFRSEFHSNGATAAIDNATDIYIVNCYIHSPDAASSDGIQAGRGFYFGNTVKGFQLDGIDITSLNAYAINNLIIPAGGSGIRMAADLTVSYGNTIVLDSTSAQNGIYTTGGNVENIFVMSNILMNAGSGGSGAGLK